MKHHYIILTDALNYSYGKLLKNMLKFPICDVLYFLMMHPSRSRALNAHFLMACNPENAQNGIFTTVPIVYRCFRFVLIQDRTFGLRELVTRRRVLKKNISPVYIGYYLEYKK